MSIDKQVDQENVVHLQWNITKLLKNKIREAIGLACLCDAQACDDTKGHDWTHGPTAARVRVNVCILHYPQRSCRYMWLGLPLKAMLMLKGHAATILI